MEVTLAPSNITFPTLRLSIFMELEPFSFLEHHPFLSNRFSSFHLGRSCTILIAANDDLIQAAGLSMEPSFSCPIIACF